MGYAVHENMVPGACVGRVAQGRADTPRARRVCSNKGVDFHGVVGSVFTAGFLFLDRAAFSSAPSDWGSLVENLMVTRCPRWSQALEILCDKVSALPSLTVGRPLFSER